jgi:lipopolysaccharide transport system permease protein
MAELKTIIEAGGRAKLLNIKELIRYKDLIYFFVLRDVTVIYSQTILGIGWAIINPLFSTIVFSFIFGKLASMPSDGIPYAVFTYSAMIPWTYFSGATVASTNSLIGARNIFTKIYFPRIIFPITPILSKLIDFMISFVMLFIIMFYYNVTPAYSFIYIPFLMVIMLITTMAAGIWLSSLALQYRDVRFALTLLMQLLLYAAPEVFPASLVLTQLGEPFYLAYGIYPMTGVIEGFRSAIVGNEMPWELITVSSVSSSLFLITGLWYFSLVERKFADVA